MALKKMSDTSIIINETDKNIANFIKNYKKGYNIISAEEIAFECNVSLATITRFAKKLDFNGFRELKYNLTNKNEIISKDFEYEYIKTLQDSLSAIDKEVDQELIEWAAINILNANKVSIFAYGGTYVTALDFSYKLKRIGFDVSCEADSHYKFVSAKNAKLGSLAIVISYSGQTREINEIIEILQERHIQIIYFTAELITSNKELVHIPIPKTDERDRVLSLSSRITMLAIFDIICLKILKKNPDKYSTTLSKNRM